MEMAYGPTEIRSACLWKGLTADGAGVYDTYHTTRKGEAPMSHLGQHGQCQSDGFGYQANQNGLLAYGDVYWGTGLMVPWLAMVVWRCNIACGVGYP